jgi:hypothetical protein
MDEESIFKIFFRRELPAQGRGIRQRNGIPPGITSSKTKNPTEEEDYASNYKLIFRPETPICTENPLNGNNSRISNSKSSMLSMPTFLQKYKLKPHKNEK